MDNTKYLSKNYKHFTKMIPFFLSIISLIFLVAFTSKLYLPDDRKNMTDNWGYKQTSDSSFFTFQKYEYNQNENSLYVAITQVKNAYTDESDGKQKFKTEHYKMYLLVDGKRFSDFAVNFFDDTYKYQYIINVPLPKFSYYTLYLIIENVDNKNGVYATIDYRDVNKPRGEVKQILELQKRLLKINEDMVLKSEQVEKSELEKTKEETIKKINSL